MAALRIYEFLNNRPAGLNELAGLLNISTDELSRISRMLEREGIVGGVRSGASECFRIDDYLRIEDLQRDVEALAMQDEIKSFQQSQQARLGELEKTMGRKQEKEDLFGKLEQALKDPASMKKKNPLD